MSGTGSRVGGAFSEIVHTPGDMYVAITKGERRYTFEVPAACADYFGTLVGAGAELTDTGGFESPLGTAVTGLVQRETCRQALVQKQIDGTLVIKSEVG